MLSVPELTHQTKADLAEPFNSHGEGFVIDRSEQKVLFKRSDKRHGIYGLLIVFSVERLRKFMLLNM